MATGQELARQGQDDALAAATVAHLHHLDEVRDAFQWWVTWTCGSDNTGDRFGFTSEDVRKVCDDSTISWLDRHPNVLPALFGGASRAKRIHAIGWATPQRPSRHGNAIRLWKGAPRDRAA